MTRFDAASADDRRRLFAEAVRAHRQRNSAYLTLEAAPPDDDDADADPLESTPDPDAIGEDDGDADPAPWIQFSEGTVNLDCTDAELERLKSLLDEYPAFRVDELESPDGADGTNVRVTARADENRLAGFFERAFREVYDRPENYRAWVAEV